jgi:hypothetical protein
VIDVGMHKPLKGYLRNEFDNWLVANAGKKTKPALRTVCNCVKRAYDSASTSTLINSWH